MNLYVRKKIVTNFTLKIEIILESVEGQGKSIDTYSCISSKYKEDFVVACFCLDHWDKEQQSKVQNLDSKYRQMALTGFDT